MSFQRFEKVCRAEGFQPAVSISGQFGRGRYEGVQVAVKWYEECYSPRTEVTSQRKGCFHSCFELESKHDGDT